MRIRIRATERIAYTKDVDVTEEEYRELQSTLKSAQSGPPLDPDDMGLDPRGDVVDGFGLDDCEIEVLEEAESDQ